MGSIDVGSKITTEPRIEARPIRAKQSADCGAMSQQCGDNGNVSAPQKLVHLVGCREPKARGEPWVRPGPPKQ